MRTSTIRAISHALPAKSLTYEELAERFGEKQVASIYKMSGIRDRRVVEFGQCASDLAVSAAERLLQHAAVDRSSIRLLIFASQTPDYRVPATACRLQAELGLPEACAVFDINQACASFIFALQVAHSMVVAQQTECALLLNADALTALINPMDRGLVPLHGDAAAASLVVPADSDYGGIEFFEVGSAGHDYQRLIVPAGGFRLPSSVETRQETTDESGCVRTLEQLHMDGPAIFHFALFKVKDFLQKVLQRKGLSVEDFDLVLFHQANRTMIDLLYKNLGVPTEKRFYYLDRVGNSSGASLPSLLSQAWREGVVKPGSRTLLCAFGGGLSWGAFSIRWPEGADAAIPGQVDTPLASGSS